MEERRKVRVYRTVNGKTVRVCDECGADMVVRKNRDTGEEFLGCQNWPKCDFTTPLPVDVQMRIKGYQTLPGME